MKKWLGLAVIIVMVIIMIAGGYEFLKRNTLSDCEISMASVEIESIGLTTATLNIGLNIHNPTWMTATIYRMDYVLYGNDIRFGEGEFTEKVDIPSDSDEVVTSTIEVTYVDMGGVAWSVLSDGDIIWRVDGTTHFDTPFGTLSRSFSNETELEEEVEES